MNALFPRTVNNANTATTEYDTVITSSGTAHTKGSWTQLLAATAFDGFFLEILMRENHVTATDTSGLLDIGYDAAGGTSYTVAVPNILCGFAFTGLNSDGREFRIPVYIPAGSTVAARWQATQTSDAMEVGIKLHGGVPASNPFPPQGLVVDYGTATGSSSGTTLANAGSHAESAWTELSAATTHPHQGLSLAVQGTDGSFGANSFILVDIGIGAASSEVEIINNEWITVHAIEAIYTTFSWSYYARSIPEGSRLAVRSQCSVNNRNNDAEVAVYGWG